MKSLTTFGSLRDDNTQNVSRDGIKLATIFYDFDSIVFDQDTKAIGIQEVIEIAQAVKANSVPTSEHENACEQCEQNPCICDIIYSPNAG